MAPDNSVLRVVKLGFKTQKVVGIEPELSESPQSCSDNSVWLDPDNFFGFKSEGLTAQLDLFAKFFQKLSGLSLTVFQ